MPLPSKVFIILNFQANQVGESAFTIPADPKRKSLDEVSLIGSYEFLTEKYPDFVKTITLLNKYYKVIFFNNSFKSGRERIES